MSLTINTQCIICIPYLSFYPLSYTTTFFEKIKCDRKIGHDDDVVETCVPLSQSDSGKRSSYDRMIDGLRKSVGFQFSIREGKGSRQTRSSSIRVEVRTGSTLILRVEMWG